MVNVKIFHLKSIIKYSIFTLILLITLFLLLNFKNIRFNYCLTSCLNNCIPGISLINNSNSQNNNFLQTILYSELRIINTSFNIPSTDPYVENFSIVENESIEYTDENSSTEIISSNISNTFTNEYNGVEIKNSTNYSLTQDILNPSSLNINTSNIIIFHTHTCESYTLSDSYQYEASGNFRTIDLERSISKVGSQLATYLTSYNYNVIHDTTYHDYPAYSGSYGRSMVTVQNLLNLNPNTDIIIDLHRDALNDPTYAPSLKIDNEIVSQLMFVIGTDGGGLEHSNWQENLKFAIKVQEKANELYPRIV